jgi:hypothetical protein
MEVGMRERRRAIQNEMIWRICRRFGPKIYLTQGFPGVVLEAAELIK